MNLAKLKELERSAIKSPWKRGEYNVNVVDIPGGDIVVTGGTDEHEELEYTCDLIVTLRNLAPELIAVVEAAQTLSADLDGRERGDRMPYRTHMALDAALDALHAKLAQEKCP